MAIFPQGKTAIERRCNPGERKLFHALKRHLTDDYLVWHDLPIGAGRESAQDTVNQIGQEITKRNLSVQPTLTIRPGFPMRVMVNKDLVLRPYQSCVCCYCKAWIL